ncbi:UDP-N-acetylmuramoyl-L-alanine--D-glutamate ligase [Candidatus Magnetominusculus xianensis]|uniref:UDP-N-acetylmuramoylalanine--D-glutamate ligase n=1 Tax=Candidatus Magnetominusculus xianensis TaxID=1748249 RepID=A0ABR5SGG7_9BACT|nr:UDP-N-acetylmuramoyl-L-alanine--D-glutamate ligase [Candidatus Magnetominusculus xianensis]KWT89806.1 UDP-N-acetylmuramoylalanine--D-glutamate ligase [Candidatus Magnetominusculus xianensis]MBF0404593.1 UDP-N-acetylmuramoyl-L-alanine--D-glutamate ligase [Nitrospirota bacterium]
MEMYKNYKGKHVVVVGLARSGVGAANLLVRLGAAVTVMDVKGADELAKYIAQLDPSVTIKLGHHNEEIIDTADTVVPSPGVPLTIPILERARQKGIRIVGELELAYQVLEELRKTGAAGFMAITGTNGKSTTTTLLYEILIHSGFNAIIGGNIGKALTEEINKLVKDFERPREFVSPEYIVTEVSSFQLESAEKFKPKVAAILNVTPDHLDRHNTMDEYLEAKCRIFQNQDQMNFLVLNADDPLTPKIVEKVKPMGPEILYFSRKKQVRGAYYAKGIITFNIPELEVLCPELVVHEIPVFHTNNFKIKGLHNIENAMAASLMALVSGCSVADIYSTLTTFKGLEHRLEFVEEVDGVKYFNDSKGTNIWSVVKSLEGFEESIVLIAGGRDKAGDFSPLKDLIKEKVKAVVLIGEAAGKIKEAVKSITEVHMASSMQDAVTKSKEIAGYGDIVLLSPACASFDMFRDFEERGAIFKEAVLRLPGDRTVMDVAIAGN